MLVEYALRPIQPKNVKVQWCVFLIDKNGAIIASANQELVGKDVARLVEVGIEDNDITRFVTAVTEGRALGALRFPQPLFRRR